MSFQFTVKEFSAVDKYKESEMVNHVIRYVIVKFLIKQFSYKHPATQQFQSRHIMLIVLYSWIVRNVC